MNNCDSHGCPLLGKCSFGSHIRLAHRREGCLLFRAENGLSQSFFWVSPRLNLPLSVCGLKHSSLSKGHPECVLGKSKTKSLNQGRLRRKVGFDFQTIEVIGSERHDFLFIHPLSNDVILDHVGGVRFIDDASKSSNSRAKALSKISLRYPPQKIGTLVHGQIYRAATRVVERVLPRYK